MSEQESAPGASQEGDKATTKNTDDLPDWARAELEQARKEAAKYRTKAKELEPLAAKAQELEEAGKGEVQKLADRLAAAEKAGTESSIQAMRLEVALEKGLTKTQAKRLVGSTVEELQADADDLLASFKSEPSEPPPPGKPREQLRGGGQPQEDPKPDIRKVVSEIPRGV